MKLSVDLFSFLAGTLVGSGAIWSFLNYQISRKESELKRFEAINSIRSQLFDLMEKLKETQSYSADLREGKVQIEGIVKNVLNQLKTEIDLICSDILVKEDQLSKLEDREPRIIHKSHGGRPSPPGKAVFK